MNLEIKKKVVWFSKTILRGRLFIMNSVYQPPPGFVKKN
jgi:hypothetical protein